MPAEQPIVPEPEAPVPPNSATAEAEAIGSGPEGSENVAPASEAPAGWYPDGDKERWWNGVTWTNDSRPTVVNPEKKPRARVPLFVTIASTGGAAFIFLILGLVLGAVIGSASSSSTSAANASVAAGLEGDLAALQSHADTLQDQLDAQAEKAAALDARAAELDARDAAVAAREAAIGPAEQAAAANTFAGDGAYIVGTDVQPGTYKSDGGSPCYWARKNASGDDIIDNSLGDGASVLTIQPGDGLVEVSGCAPFTKVG